MKLPSNWGHWTPTWGRFPSIRGVAIAMLVALVATHLGACGESPGNAPAADAQETGRRDVPDTSDVAQDVAPLTDAPAADAASDADAQALAPTAEAGDDVTAAAGMAVAFDGSESSDSDGAIVAWEWSFGDGSADAGDVVFHTYSEAGEYVARLTVTDDDGLTDSDIVSVLIEAPNVGPNAAIRGPREVVRAVESDFDGFESEDPDGEIVAYSWDVGVDGVEPLSGATLSYAWDDWGDVSLQLTVEDDEGATDSAVHPVRVLAPPTAVADGPLDATVGDEVMFDGSESFDEDGSLVAWLWTFPDAPLTSEGVAPTHIFSTPGEFDVILEVTDDDGLTGLTTHKIVILPPPNLCPRAEITGDLEWLTLETVSLSGASSSDDDGSVAGYIWTWGDDSGSDLGASGTHSYADDGSYTVTLTIADDDGCTYEADNPATHTARDSVELTIANRPPVPVLDVEPTSAEPGATISFDATGSTDPDGSVVSQTIDFDDGFSASADTVTHVYAAEGVYEVELTVRDDDDAVERLTVDVTIATEPESYAGTYLLDGSVSYDCFGGFGSYSFSQLSVTQAGTTLSISPNPPASPPGAMAGTLTGVDFFVSRVASGVCTETYAIDGTFSGNTFSGTFTSTYVGGGACLDCTNQSFDVNGTLSE